MRFLGRICVLMAGLALLAGAAVPAVSAPISEITVVQDQLATDGIIINVTGDGMVGALGELLLGVSGTGPGVVFHDNARLEFSQGQPWAVRFAIEGLAFDWNTGFASGFVGGIKDRNPIFGAQIDVFQLFMAKDGTFELAWTQAASDVFNMVFDNGDGGVAPGVFFGIAALGVDPHVPEPATALLMLGGMIGLAGYGRRSRP